MKTLWIVGKTNDGLVRNDSWEFAGVFDTEEKAIEACYTNRYFIGPIEINKKLDKETEEWEGAYYPHDK